jgi:hypothetical protein
MKTWDIIGSDQVKEVVKDVPGGMPSKSQDTEIRKHRVVNGLKGLKNSLLGQCILRGQFLCQDCSSNGVKEGRDYWGLKLSGQSP